MLDQEKKERKKAIKAFRQEISKWYTDAVEKFNDDYFSQNDIKLLTKHHGPATYQLQLIVKKQEQERRKKVYEAIINDDKELAETLMKEANNRLQTLEDRLLELTSKRYYDTNFIKLTNTDEELDEAMQEELDNKKKNIKQVSNQIEKTKKVIEQLTPLIQEQKKEKPGRPNEGKTKAAKSQKNFEKEVAKAYSILVKSNKVSASLLQREMNIGFNKATKIVNFLTEDEKIIDDNGVKKLNINQEEK